MKCCPYTGNLNRGINTYSQHKWHRFHGLSPSWTVPDDPSDSSTQSHAIVTSSTTTRWSQVGVVCTSFLVFGEKRHIE